MPSEAMPLIRLKAREDRRIRRGHCWVYDGEIADAPDDLTAGRSVLLTDADGRPLASALWNPASLIRARVFSRRPGDFADLIDEHVLAAQALRGRLYREKHYRLVYGESDGLPGLVVDRYGPVLVAQISSAVAEAHSERLCDSLRALAGVDCLVIRRDASVRLREGLALEEPELLGELPELVWAREGGLVHPVDVLGGSKTGWFWDQRDNRAFVRRAASGARVLDLFCHSGGFALQAAAGGAKEVLGLDRSQQALSAARSAAEMGGLTSVCRWQARNLIAGQSGGKGGGNWPKGPWDLVVLDPPALAKSRGEAKAALGAYLHLNRKAASRVGRGGLLLSCSCTSPVEEEIWRGTVLRAVRKAGRGARIIYRGGQGADHPVLPGMPETRYLKVLGLQLD